MKNLLLLGCLLLAGCLQAQIKGVVQGLDSTQTKPLKNVKITLKRAQQTVYSNEDGSFEIYLGKQTPDTLLFEIKGYRSDQLVVTRADRFAALHVVLVSGQMVQEIVVQHQKDAHGISKMKTKLKKRIIQETESKGLSAVELAEISGLSRTVVSGILNGSLLSVSLERLIRLASALELTVDLNIKNAA